MKVKGENGALRAKHRENKLDSYFALVNGDLLINFINRTDTKQNFLTRVVGRSQLLRGQSS